MHTFIKSVRFLGDVVRRRETGDGRRGTEGGGPSTDSGQAGVWASPCVLYASLRRIGVLCFVDSDFDSDSDWEGG